MKKQPTECEQSFVIDETSRTYFPKYTNNSIKKNLKMAEDINGHLSKEGIQVVNRHKKTCSSSLIVRDLKIKTTIVP